MSTNIVFITGNQNKLDEVKSILGNKFNVINYDIDLSEIQNTEVKKVINEKFNGVKKVLSKQEKNK